MTSTGALALRIEFLSDWHVGTGDTLSIDVDAAIARDHEGFPMVPGKTLTGLLRDAAEQIAPSLGEGWDEWVEALFGTQIGASRNGAMCAATLSVRPARLRGRLRRAIASDPDARTMVRLLAATRSSTAVDERGAARAGSLRTIEVARAGLVLIAPVELHVDGSGRDAAIAFVAACARMTESIGGGRRRGLGRARVTLVRIDRDVETAVEPDDWASALPEQAPPAPPRDAAHVAVAAASGQEGATVVVRLDIEALTPVLASPQRRGNESVSLTYLPGATLLPIVARALAAQGVDVPTALADGTLVVRHAHPAVRGADGRDGRAWPAPAVFTHAKGDARSEWWSSLAGVERPQGSPRKAVRSGWLSPDGLARQSVALASRMHNQIDDRSQRTPDHGGLYVYEAIAAGQHFVAEVVLAGACAARATDLCAAISGPASIGRSKKDDYGSVVVTARIDDQQTASEPAAATPASSTVLCLSDVVIDAPNLGPTAAPIALADAVARATGVPLLQPTARSIVRSARIDTWHASWGLPRPTLVTIAAGSVLEVTPGLNVAPGERLRIGERTAEGFGDVVVSPALLERDVPAETRAVRTNAPSASSDALATDDAVLIESLRRRATIDRIERLAVERIAGTLTGTLLEPLARDSAPLAWVGGVLDWLRAEQTSPSSSLPIMPAHLARNFKHAPKVRDLLLDANDPWNEFIGANLPDPATYRIDAAIAIMSALRDRLARDKTTEKRRA
jgi:CRISPR-associated protein Csx10